jgi:hypothetical protein
MKLPPIIRITDAKNGHFGLWEKFSEMQWTTTVGLFMVCALFSGNLYVFGNELPESELTVRLQEVEVARQAAEEHAMSLNAALIRTESALAAMRTRFSEAHIEAQRLREELAALNIRAANLLVNEEDLPDAHVLARFADDAKHAQTAIGQAYKDLVTFKGYLGSVLDAVGGPERDTYRQLLTKKLEIIFDDLRRAEQFFNPESITDSATPSGDLRVLTVNDELQVVVLSAGRLQGVRLGQLLAIREGRAKGTTLRVVETRQTLSAAMVEEGSLRQISPGTPLTRKLATQNE